jgi:hypothetical protein
MFTRRSRACTSRPSSEVFGWIVNGTGVEAAVGSRTALPLALPRSTALPPTSASSVTSTSASPTCAPVSEIWPLTGCAPSNASGIPLLAG